MKFLGRRQHLLFGWLKIEPVVMIAEPGFQIAVSNVQAFKLGVEAEPVLAIVAFAFSAFKIEKPAKGAALGGLIIRLGSY